MHTHTYKKKRGLALLLCSVLSFTALAGCGKSEDEYTSSSEEETTEVTEEETTTTEHVSPTETVTSTLGIEIDEIDALLTREGDNSYNAQIADFSVEEGDVIESFTFIVYSEDGSSSLGEYQGGYGISVSEDCEAATDTCWYQSDDFTETIDGSYAEFTWTIPSEIQSDLDLNGEVLFGHWWSGVETVRLSSIVCTFTRTKEVPVDGTNTITVGENLAYDDDDEKTCDVSIADCISADDTLQTVTFEISSSGALGKFTGAFGISVTEDADCATDTCWYQTQNICIFTDDSDLTLTWILPDNVVEAVDSGGNVQLGFWWSDQAEITLEEISVRYSNSTGTSTASTSGGTVESQSNTIRTSEEVDAMTSAEIVEDITVGWNLGNTLDCYDVDDGDDAETAWGNPTTTQEMLETVQDAGFNAVRIPVTWGEHMDEEGNIDADWMARVQEVVDYAYDLGMYVIINVHHDDYLWLTPTEEELENDEEMLTTIWSQICETFKEYDHRLLFEGMNEPRVVGSDEEWTGGTQESYDVINTLSQAFIDTVRASGGENETRTLIVTSYAQSVEDNAIAGLEVPDDDNIVVSFHVYSPWDFCGDESTVSTWGSDEDEENLEAIFETLYSEFVQDGVPVIIDEFGAVNKDNTSDRAEWYGDFVELAGEYEIKCFVWDNGVSSGESSFGLLDREDCTWYFPDIVNSIMEEVS